MGGSQFNLGKAIPILPFLVEKGPGLALKPFWGAGTSPPLLNQPLGFTAGSSGHFGEYWEILRIFWEALVEEASSSMGTRVRLQRKCFPWHFCHLQHPIPASEQNLPLPQPPLGTARLGNGSMLCFPTFIFQPNCNTLKHFCSGHLNLLFLLKSDNPPLIQTSSACFNETFRWISKSYLLVSNILIRLYSQFNPLNPLWWAPCSVFSPRCWR